ncbi:MAG: GNAT family N-acetyltransferase [Deltaproteobacteria bacterium]|nr:GNAT family N-acetyltransferase [Deltaproteobacteria bacterium]MBW2388441.1 GNAT family N-acetyltransferase [Deltaproteobacteria bacterium]MBW2723513.1 GNAT family N-acetyltransferase [Deltaproteobacteria bacterium]
MSHVIRPATQEDVPMLAEVVLLASRSHLEIGVFDLIIETNDDDRLAAISTMLTTDTRSWCHYENFLLAWVDGRPAAALSGFAAHDESLLPLEKAFVAGFRAVGMDDEQIGTAFKNSLVFLTCSSDDEQGAWVIEWVACLEAFRRRGLIRELLQAILERGRERGHKLSQIGLLLGNISAQRAYEDVGFEIEYEKTDPSFEAAIGCPGMARLLLRG